MGGKHERMDGLVNIDSSEVLLREKGLVSEDRHISIVLSHSTVHHLLSAESHKLERWRLSLEFLHQLGCSEGARLGAC